MPRRAAPHRGLDVHYGESADESGPDGPDDGPAAPSKTQLKREAESLQALGRELAELPDARLAAAPMPDALREAVLEYRRTRSHEGRRRQLQYVGKLMRGADETALREAVAAARLGSAAETLALHRAERWRAELIADDEALTRWAAQQPASDLQQLRSLVRAARRDQVDTGERQPRSHRELFRFVREALAATDSADR